MRIRTCCNAACGFTLIELLVVIAIIAVLAGILFPVFASARTTAYKATCQSNLKQLYAAFEMYANDWDDSFPSPGGLTGDFSYWLQEGNGGIRPYVNNNGSKSIFCCPAYADPGKSRWTPCTYGMNSYLRYPWDQTFPDSVGILKGIRQSQILDPTQTVLLYEGQPAAANNAFGEGFVYRCGNWTGARGYYKKTINGWKLADKPVHNTTNSYLMCDGHVISMQPERDPFRGPLTVNDNIWFVQRLR